MTLATRDWTGYAWPMRSNQRREGMARESHTEVQRGLRRFACLCVLGAVVGGGVAGCGGSADANGPEAALGRFLEAMDRSARDSEGLREAYTLLAQEARDELKARAARAFSLSGRKFEPWEMLSQGRFRLRFAPARSGGMQASIAGEHALVIVRGEDGGQAEVPMRLEADGWRVALAIPPLSPVSAKSDGTDSETPTIEAPSDGVLR